MKKNTNTPSSLLKPLFAVLISLLLCLPLMALADQDQPFSEYLVDSPSRVYFEPRQAVAQSPVTGAVGLCDISDDYEMPSALYFNGVGFTITASEHSLGGYPPALEDPEEIWVLAQVEVPEGGHVISGLIPRAAVRFLDEGQAGDTSPALPLARLSDSAQDVPLYFDNGLSDRVLQPLPPSAQFSVLGLMHRFAHVMYEGQAGFVPIRQLQFLDESMQQYFKGLPPDSMGFHDIMPGHIGRYIEYRQKFDQIAPQDGYQASQLTLQQKAELSALALSYGFEYMNFINILPGENDLSPDQATDIGQRLLMDKYGYQQEEIDRMRVSFFHWPDQPEEHFWEIALQAKFGVQNAIVTLNQAGEPVDYFLAMGKPVGSGLNKPELVSQSQQDAIEAYLMNAKQQTAPAEGDLSREEAEAAALQTMRDTLKDLDIKDLVLTTAGLYQLPGDQGRYWLFAWGVKDAPKEETAFAVALLMGEQTKAVSTDREEFIFRLEDLKTMRKQTELEQERGPFATWSVQEKADFYPRFYQLPPENAISQEEALRLAQEALIGQAGVQPAEFSSWTACFSYTNDDQWLVEFHTPETLPKPGHYHYQVFLAGPDGELVDLIGPDSHG